MEITKGKIEVAFGKRESVVMQARSYNKWAYNRKPGGAQSGEFGRVKSWYRVGRFSFIEYADDVAVALTYTSGSDFMQPDSEFYDAHKRMRLDMLRRAEMAMRDVNHPMLAQVMLDIKAERAHYKQKATVPQAK